MLHRHRTSHVGVFVLAVLLVGILGSVLFLSAAIQEHLATTLDDQADLVVQRVRGGKVVDLPAGWAQEFATIPGVRSAVPRVFGRYFHEPNAEYFTVVGVDLFEPQSAGRLQELVDGLDMRSFLSRPSMIIGSGVRRFLDEAYYTDAYTFKTPDLQSVVVQVHEVLPQETDLVGNDLVIMELNLARQVLGVKANQATDIVLEVPNELEGDAVMGKLIQMHYDIRVIQKKEIAAAYGNLFNFEGGVFLVLWLTVMAAFVLILYQRYSLITGTDRREIGILRAVGWSIKEVITLKVVESAVVAVAAWLLGVVLAYLYVFILGAPGLSAIFFGYQNLPVDYALNGTLDAGNLAMIFLFFVGPFLAAVLIPVWRVAVIDPVEAMK